MRPSYLVIQLLLSCGCLLLAIALDRALGEPKRFHPIVIFGNWANAVESRLNPRHIAPSNVGRGILAWAIAVLPVVACFSLIAYLAAQASTLLLWLLEAFVLYLCIGWRSLKEHMLAIYSPLASNQLDTARQACAMIVSRDTQALDETDVAKAAVESTLENGSDGIYAAVFWFAVLGLPGVVLYRLSNTLDAMWGYRTERFESFGKWAAKVDDALNWAPAKITAWLYVANAFFIKADQPKQLAKSAINNWRMQAPLLSSPNGGPVMITGATVLDIKLGGPTSYHGEIMDKPFFGGTTTVTKEDIPKALQLVDRTLAGWVIIAALLSALL